MPVCSECEEDFSDGDGGAWLRLDQLADQAEADLARRETRPTLEGEAEHESLTWYRARAAALREASRAL